MAGHDHKRVRLTSEGGRQEDRGEAWPSISARWPQRMLHSLIVSDLLSGGLSAAMLLWRGHVENGRAAAPVNAIAHWVWPRSAYRQTAASTRFTLTGLAVHFTAALLWCGIYDGMHLLRSRPARRHAALDALAVGVAAAVVDLACVPERLTPGFEKRLSASGLVLVYGSFVAGLALAGLATRRKR